MREARLVRGDTETSSLVPTRACVPVIQLAHPSSGALGSSKSSQRSAVQPGAPPAPVVTAPLPVAVADVALAALVEVVGGAILGSVSFAVLFVLMLAMNGG